jgi:hypothetical protein
VTAHANGGSVPEIAGQLAQVALPGAPANVSLPTASGSTVAGQRLTATTGSWTDATGYRYQWVRCDSSGGNCLGIGGATGATYTVAAADAGHALRVVVVASGFGGSAGAQSDPTSAATLPPAPAATVAPTITGTTTVSQQLTGTLGSWNVTSGTFTTTRQWLRCDAQGANCVPITSATAPTYTLTKNDTGATVVLRISAKGLGGTTTDDSDPTAVVVLPPAPSNTALPKITGNPTAGKTLSVSPGSWTALGGDTIALQWQRCDPAGATCAPIAGATKSTYVLTAADAGNTIVVHATATGLGGATSADSAASAVIAAAPAPVNSTAPSVTGAASVGKTLTGSRGVWTNATAYTYAWLRCSDPLAASSCTAITGATGSTYTVKASDSGNYLVFQVTGSGPGGSVAKTSTVTALVP